MADAHGRAATPPGWEPSAAASAAWASSAPERPSSPHVARWCARSWLGIGPKALPQLQKSRLLGGGGGTLAFGGGDFARGATIPRTGREPTRCFLTSRLGHVLSCLSCVLGIPAGGAAQPAPSTCRKPRVSRSVISSSSSAEAALPTHGGSRGACPAAAPAGPEGAKGAANGEATSDGPRLRSRFALPLACAPSPAAATAGGSTSIPAPAAPPTAPPAAPPAAPGSSFTSRSGPEGAQMAAAMPGLRSAATAGAPWTAPHPQAKPEPCHPPAQNFDGPPGGRAGPARRIGRQAQLAGCGQTRDGHVDVERLLQRVTTLGATALRPGANDATIDFIVHVTHN